MLIDVRTKEEFDAGHADGAVNLSLQDIDNGVNPDCDTDEPLQLYCRSGGRSEMAKQILLSRGYSNVENLGGLSKVLDP
jgi:phage shock protein E